METLKKLEVALRHYESQKKASNKYYNNHSEEMKRKRRERYAKEKELKKLANSKTEVEVISV
jgi:hypothetical protein